MDSMRLLFDDGPLAVAGLMADLQDEFNNMFRARFRRGSMVFPPLNVWVKDDEAIVEAEVPGVDIKDIEVSVTGDTLTIRGERKKESSGGKQEATYHRRERWSGAFNRTIGLPFRVDGNKVSATSSNGVLRIVLPRSEEDKAKKIHVVAE